MSQPALISAQDLGAQLSSGHHPSPLLLDVRWKLGTPAPQNRDGYLAEHLPGAVFVDLETALTGHGGENLGRHPMPAVDDFELAMARCGVDNDRPVVCYDDFSSLPAARCWWLLRHFGKRDVQVLDGGLGAWKAAGLPLASGPETVDEGDYEVRRGHSTVLRAEDIPGYLRDGVVLDGRPADRFRGENETIDPVAGHIPGARSLPAFSLLDDHGRFLPPEKLRQAALEVGASPSTRIAAYCGSGVQAAHLALALSVAGISDETDVYIGSWSDWITNPTRPVTTESAPATP